MQGKNRKNSRKTRPAVSTGQTVIEGGLRKEVTIGKIIGHMQNIEYLSLRCGYNDMSWSLGNAACRGESTFPCLICLPLAVFAWECPDSQQNMLYPVCLLYLFNDLINDCPFT
jgi:hypothetical protein